MSKIFPSHKKSKQFLQIVYQNRQGLKQDTFLRNYSQLLNQHFSISDNQKTQLRRTTSSLGFSKYKSKKKASQSRQKLEPSIIEIYDKDGARIVSSFDLVRSASQSHKTPSNIMSNPEKQQKISELLMRKTFQVEKDSFENILLNNRLKQSTTEKNNLLNFIVNYRRQIAQQKKTKAKLSLKLGKIMNQNENASHNLSKTQKQTDQTLLQIQSTQAQYQKQQRKNARLIQIHEMNLEKIQIQRQMIEQLQARIYHTKVDFYQTKTHVNELKSLLMQETNCLTKNQINHQTFLQQRDNMCKIVHSSALFAIQKSKI